MVHDAREQRAWAPGLAPGANNPQAWYEDAVGALLGRVGALDDATLAEVVRLHAAHRPEADESALARIEREREAATRKLAQTRDVVAWQTAMGRLDAAEALARQPLEGHRLTAPEVVAYLRSLPSLWADSGPEARQAIATGVFAGRTCWGTSGWSTSSHPTRSRWVSTRRCPRRRARRPDR